MTREDALQELASRHPTIIAVEYPCKLDEVIELMHYRGEYFEDGGSIPVVIARRASREEYTAATSLFPPDGYVYFYEVTSD